VLIAVGVSLVVYLVTRNRRYVTFAPRVLQLAFVLLIAFPALYVLERGMLVI
jgi:hypothetical protein